MSCCFILSPSVAKLLIGAHLTSCQMQTSLFSCGKADISKNALDRKSPLYCNSCTVCKFKGVWSCVSLNVSFHMSSQGNRTPLNLYDWPHMLNVNNKSLRLRAPLQVFSHRFLRSDSVTPNLRVCSNKWPSQYKVSTFVMRFTQTE